MIPRQFTLAIRLAFQDFLHERRLSFCSVVGLAAVLAPLLVLYGLKFGIISSMSESLSRDPRARELRPIGHGVYDQSFFDALGARSAVGYLEPSTRFLAAMVSLRNRAVAGAEPVNAELWPSGPRDPLLQNTIVRPLGIDELVLSRGVADKLRVKAGDRIDGRIGRRVDGVEESVRPSLVVAAVLPSGLVERDVAFVGRELLLATEDYREGHTVQALGWPGKPRPEGPRGFASFRLFATDIDQVEALRDHLGTLGIDTLTRLADIRTVQRLDRSLTLLFLVIAGLGITGYTLSLAVSLWAMTLRKRRDLSTLRLIGFSSQAISLFPAMNAGLTALLGSLCAILLYLAIEPLLNLQFAGGLEHGTVVARLGLGHYLAAVGGTLACALLASVMAGFNAAKFEPAEGLRDV